MLLGLSIAAPVGPMAMLCIGRTLERGALGGVIVGLGIATGDAIYGCVAAFGFSAITATLIAQAAMLRVIGGVFLVWLGVRAWPRGVARAGPTQDATARSHTAWLRDWFSAIGLTLTNPATILSFLAAFAALGLARQSAGPHWLVAGVFAGSALWWLLLCAMVGALRHTLSTGARLWIARASAIILLTMGTLSALGVLA